MRTFSYVIGKNRLESISGRRPPRESLLIEVYAGINTHVQSISNESLTFACANVFPGREQYARSKSNRLAQRVRPNEKVVIEKVGKYEFCTLYSSLFERKLDLEETMFNRSRCFKSIIEQLD